MEIEFKSPEEALPPGLVPFATGKKEMEIKSVDAQRTRLKEKVKRGEEVEISEIAEVNTFSRIETMKEKTRELAEWLRTAAEWLRTAPGVVYIGTVGHALDIYDELAWDWVYGNELRWEEGLACEQIKKIKTLVMGKLGEER